MMNRASFAEWFFGRLFGVFVRLDGIRVAHPGAFYWITGITTFGLGFSISFVFNLKGIPNPGWWTSVVGSSLPLSSVLLIVVGLVSGFIVNIIAARVGIPMLIYAPQSLAMRNLGLYRITTDPAETLRLIASCAKRHDSAQKVKVICISGRHLFREPQLILGKKSHPCPLHQLAKEGSIEAIFPETDASNYTISERFLTYSEGYRKDQGIPRIEDFLREIHEGKCFLLRNADNVVLEHNILCVWRVILFSEHCLVQTYFPNTNKGHSYEAPTFVYSRIDDPRYQSYYAVYAHLYEMVKKRSRAIAPFVVNLPPPA